MWRHIEEVHNKTKVNTKIVSVSAYPHKCDQCDFSSKRKHDLKRHVMQKHSLCQLSFNCNTCGKSYAYKGSLERHMKMHYMGGGDATKSVGSGMDPKEFLSDEDSSIQAHRQGGASIMAHGGEKAVTDTESVGNGMDAKESVGSEINANKSLGDEDFTIQAHRNDGAAIVAHGCGVVTTDSVRSECMCGEVCGGWDSC